LFNIDVGTMCAVLTSPLYGSVEISPGPNAIALGLGSVANYSCYSNYNLVGDQTRTCQDSSGGTVTTGTWSGPEPTCQGTSTKI